MLGILKHLLFWPVTGPSYLIRFSLERIHRIVQEELTDDTRIKAELLELQLALELGDIDQATYLAREAELMEQLRDIRERREQLGMSVSGGLVQVRSEATVEPIVSSEAITDADARTAAAADETKPAARVADPRSARVELTFDQD
jgi:hypothetical protein